MSDDLAAKAANWVPPWQRPADESDAEGPGGAAQDDDEGPSSRPGLPGQWDGLAGAKWQSVEPGESSDEPDERDELQERDEALDQEVSDPQLSDCVSEDDVDVDVDVDADLDDKPTWNARATAPEDELSGDPGGGPDVPAVQEVQEVKEVQEVQDVPDAGSKGGGKRSRPKRPAEGESQAQQAGAGDDGFEQGQLFVPAQRVSEDRPSITEAELVPALEAILMVVDEPVGEILLAQVLDVPAEQVADALLRLSATYTEEGKGFDLRRAAGGWRFYTRAEYSAYVERFVLDGQQLRLTQASLETLAVVAYKQPVTRSRISAIRGVNCDGVVRTLVTRGLIEECGTEPESGAHLYKTTNLFLEKLGLDSVEQLPPLAPFLPDNLDEVALHE